jgi:dTDP-4-dehydrorhamnose reductase
MKILVTGANGQMGNEIRELAATYGNYDFFFTDLPEVNLTDGSAVNELVEQVTPACIINCAAYTAVDKAETETEMAYKINRDAVAYIASAASRINAFLIHLSTDYVFSGKATQPYLEDGPTEPISAYGKTKLEGEREVFRNTTRALIIRTAWLYSSFGQNFVRTMLRLGRERGEVNVVTDQQGSPTYAHDLAKAILDILPACGEIRHTDIFHYTNHGVTNWFEFARSIFELTGIDCRVNPVMTKDYPTAAQRPFYSVLDTSKIRKTFGIEIPFWKDSLLICLKKLGEIKG